MLNFLMCLLVLMLSPAIVNDTSDIRTMVERQDANYNETYDEVLNAECGLYEPVFYRFKLEGNAAPLFGGRFLHLRLDISAFCAKYNGEDVPLSDDALRCLDEMLDYIEGKGHAAVIRFAYDDYFDGLDVAEPPLEMILLHQEILKTQLSFFIRKRNQKILAMETFGFKRNRGKSYDQL